MALVSVALIGRTGEPLYVRDFVTTSTPSDGAAGGNCCEEDVAEPDFFGLGAAVPAEAAAATATAATEGAGDDHHYGRQPKCSLRHQFLLRASLDRLDALTARGVMRPPPPNVPAADAMFVGLLCPIEEVRFYGYVSSTRIGIVVGTEDFWGWEGAADDAAREKAREAEIKGLMANIHSLYVEHVLNPFSSVYVGSGKIESKRFHDGITRLGEGFNGVLPKGMAAG